MDRATELASFLEGTSDLTVVCHDNPDPDCLASALALRCIADSIGVEEITIAYGGEISHQQNRAFVNALELDLAHVEGIDVEDVACLAFVDHSQPGANTVIPASIEPDVVVDHHPGPAVDAPFTDVRVEYGATATIFVEYLRDLEVIMTERLSTALLFALHRERLDYVRDPTEREYEAALSVFPDADLEEIHQLYGTAFTPATLDAIGRAITTRERRGSSIAANVGLTAETDALPQAADYLLNLEGVDTVLAYGVVGGTIRLSARSIDPRVNVGETLRTAFGDFGTVGGHYDMAGGRIELGLFGDDAGDEKTLLAFVSRRITTRFFRSLNLEDEQALE